MSGRLLGCTTTLVVGLVVVLAAAAFLTREPARAPVEEAGARSSVAAAPSSEVPSGQDTSPVAGHRRVRVTEEELNRWLAEHAAELRPASDPQAEIDVDGIALHVRIYGWGATYRARPVVRDGRLVLEDGRIEGPLGLGMSAESVTARLQAALDERLARAGLRPVAAELQPPGHAHGGIRTGQRMKAGGQASDPVAVVRAVLAALNRGDLETALGYCADDIVLWAPGPTPSGTELRGKQAPPGFPGGERGDLAGQLGSGADAGG
jgi:hypothetical protein